MNEAQKEFPNLWQEPSYFDDPIEAEKLREEAVSWIGTPFAELHVPHVAGARDVKGIGGGIDCVGLLQEIFSRTGATDRFILPRTAGDYQSNQLGKKVLVWMRGQADNEESRRLGEILVELKIPKAAFDIDAETPLGFFKTGDILVMRSHGLFHLPILVDESLHFVNALPRRGVIEGTIQDSSYRLYLETAFRLRPKATSDKSEYFVAPERSEVV